MLPEVVRPSRWKFSITSTSTPAYCAFGAMPIEGDWIQNAFHQPGSFWNLQRISQ